MITAKQAQETSTAIFLDTDICKGISALIAREAAQGGTCLRDISTASMSKQELNRLYRELNRLDYSVSMKFKSAWWWDNEPISLTIRW